MNMQVSLHLEPLGEPGWFISLHAVNGPTWQLGHLGQGRWSALTEGHRASFPVLVGYLELATSPK